MLAERLGGYVPDPGDAALSRISNHPFAQAALDPDLPVEAFIAALGALDDQLDLNLLSSHLRHADNEVVRQALRLIASDKQRHVMFAWTFLGSRLPTLDAARRGVGHEAVRQRQPDAGDEQSADGGSEEHAEGPTQHRQRSGCRELVAFDQSRQQRLEGRSLQREESRVRRRDDVDRDQTRLWLEGVDEQHARQRREGNFRCQDHGAAVPGVRYGASDQAQREHRA